MVMFILEYDLYVYYLQRTGISCEEVFVKPILDNDCKSELISVWSPVAVLAE